MSRYSLRAHSHEVNKDLHEDPHEVLTLLTHWKIHMGEPAKQVLLDKSNEDPRADPHEDLNSLKIMTTLLFWDPPWGALSFLNRKQMLAGPGICNRMKKHIVATDYCHFFVLKEHYIESPETVMFCLSHSGCATYEELPASIL